MNDRTPSADYAPNEKKIWRAESVAPVTPDPALGLKPGVYFLAIEELQGAWIDGKWEEAESSETWYETETDTYTDKEGIEHSIVTEREIRKETPRSRRYVFKEITEKGFARNVYTESYAGPRKYTK